jgi:hypothetical protein
MADSRLSQAILAVESGNKVKARELLASVLRQDPKSADAWRWMAVALDDPDKKRQCWVRVLDLRPGDEQAIKALAGLEVARQAPVTPHQTPKRTTKKRPKRERRGDSAYWTRLLLVGGIPIVLLGLCVVLAFAGALFGTGEKAVVTLTPLPGVRDVEPRIMYFCNLERCSDSDNYGKEYQEPSPLGIWKIPPQLYIELSEKERAKYGTPFIREASQGESVRVVKTWVEAQSLGPFGLWYQLDDGTWTREWQLTDEVCGPDNIDKYSYTNCAENKY